MRQKDDSSSCATCQFPNNTVHWKRNLTKRQKYKNSQEYNCDFSYSSRVSIFDGSTDSRRIISMKMLHIKMLSISHWILKYLSQINYFFSPGNLPADVDLQTGIRGGGEAVCGQEVSLNILFLGCFCLRIIIVIISPAAPIPDSENNSFFFLLISRLFQTNQPKIFTINCQ